MIHKTAIIGKNSKIGESVTIGPYTVVEDDVIIGEGTIIGSNSLIASGSRIGKNVHIFNNTSIGTIPQDLKFNGEITTLEIGDNTVIREFCQINRGTDYHYKTVIGKNCLLMAYVHVAHDCIIGDNVILVNGCQIAGHCEVHDYAILSGHVLTHQFVKIGSHVMVEGGSKVKKDLPPFIKAQGTPLKYGGVNIIGLKRRGFSEQSIQNISDALRFVFREKLSRTLAIEKIKGMDLDDPNVRALLEFLEKSDRGIMIA
ncbi:MAG: acyl-[acyl-carrier-protein]--UDP-N-acetylglucosamine O-acyltransferase [Candidatus Cloacimonadota bacterium]|nr:MAG: acyl-[acyl-carrier-protein]--UDP-N-acetylglucosamine O-acyltransferase [Candidatus Cloacimonadota bacterium]PIE77493.1 MAG: acyl-[acyl-carrier-protein]--UDP-N-acetylglucosamine O-acyltransferase [Candidatus Delongbacteria bacterium]